MPVAGLLNTSWGNGLAHGVALKASGRLVAAYRTDCADVTSDPPQFPSNCTVNPDGSKGNANPKSGHVNPTVNRLLISDDHGESWRPGGPTPIPDAFDKGNLGWTECQVAELGNGSLVLTSRVMQPVQSFDHPLPYQRMFAMSHDQGNTWASAWAFDGNQSYDSGFGPGFNTEGAIASAQGGKQLLLSKPTAMWVPGSKLGHNLYRRNLTVAASSDGGASWSTEPWGLVYEDLAAYSDIAELPNGKIGVAFERGGKKDEYRFVSFATLTPPWSVEG